MEREVTSERVGMIELGSVIADTHGDGGIYWEAAGLMPHAGISDD